MGIEGLLKAHDPEQSCWLFRGLFLAAEFDLRALPRAMLWRCRMKFTAIRLIKDEHRSMAAVLRAAEYVVGKAVSTGNRWRRRCRRHRLGSHSRSPRPPSRCGARPAAGTACRRHRLPTAASAPRLKRPRDVLHNKNRLKIRQHVPHAANAATMP